MPNINRPQGFIPTRYPSGSAYAGGVNLYCVPSTDTTQINVGDTVRSANGGDANGIPNVTKAASSDTVRGVVVGVLLSPPNLPSLVGTILDNTIQNIPATKQKAYYVQVLDDQDHIFELQDDGITALAANSCNRTASYTVANPTAPAQNSATVLTTGSVGTSNALPLRIMGLLQRPDNAYGQYARWLVKFNLHEGNAPTFGV